jgi:hypothetical protein
LIDDDWNQLLVDDEVHNYDCSGLRVKVNSMW